MSDTPSLFPELPESFAAADRPDPVIWIRRLVVYRHVEAEVTEIRNVEFRRGLNIIDTARPNEEVDGPVGHNVGKTLLTRLIRYCLGETHFGESVRERLKKELPDSYVAVEVFVEGVWWAVVRPVGADRPNASRCIQGDNWRSLADDPSGAGPYSTFLQALEGATVERFLETILPHQSRAVRWLDLLAWLSRDQYCRYRHALEWRSSFTESGTADLHNEDASVLIRLVMDLLDDSEAKLIQKHKRLLQDKRDQEAKARKLESSLAHTRQFLTERLGIAADALSNDLFAAAAKTTAETKRTEALDAIGKVADRLELPRLADEYEAAKAAFTKKERDVETEEERGKILTARIATHRKSTDAEIKAQLARLALPCPLPQGQCPLKGDGAPPAGREEFRKDQIEQLTRDLQTSEQELARRQEQLEDRKSSREAAKRAYDAAVASADRQRAEERKRISQLDAILDEAEGYRSSNLEWEKAIKETARLERAIEASRTSHHTAHQQLLARQKTLNRHLQRVLKVLVSSTSEAAIEVDMRGIHVSLDRNDATPGEALASETALSLDLACLSASICGLGYVPRFFIHDSPREADLEPHIYARLFRFIKQLEDEAAGEPNFQYIIATTTPPPKLLAVKPYVRLTLDARTDDGRLLGLSF